MDSSLLVSPAERDSLKLLERLDAAGVPIVAAYRYWDPDAEAERLVLASPLVDKEGPRALYRKIQRELRAEPPLTLQLAEITVFPPGAELVQSLSRALWVLPSSIARANSVGSRPHGPFADLVMLRPLQVGR